VSTAPARTYWIDGSLALPEAAHAPLLSHALHYGTSVFEGIRAYPTPRGVAIFRLDDHLRRFFASAEAYGLKIAYTLERLHAACCETLRASGMEDAYLRPLAYFGDETIALSPSLLCSTHVALAVFAFPPLAQGTLGFRATISPIQKFSSRALPATVKGGGHYTNSIRALAEGTVESMDVGRIAWPEADASAYFLLMAGIGFDGGCCGSVPLRWCSSPRSPPGPCRKRNGSAHAALGRA